MHQSSNLPTTAFSRFMNLGYCLGLIFEAIFVIFIAHGQG